MRARRRAQGSAFAHAEIPRSPRACRGVRTIAHPLQVVGLVLATLWACTFSPDLSRYPPCGEQAQCPPGYSCWEAERRCLPLCGENCAPADGGTAFRLISSALPDAVETVSYSQVLRAQNGTEPYAYALKGSELPAGIALSDAGLLSGAPLREGTYPFEVEVTDSSSPKQTDQASFSLSVRPLLRIGTAPALSDAVSSQSYSESLYATGGTGPNLVWSLGAGALPAGLSLGANGVISGVPTELVASKSFTVVLADSGAPPQSAQTQLQLSVRSPAAVLTILTHAVAEGRAGTQYRQQFKVSGVTGTLSWSVVSGALPSGVSLEQAGGYLYGTPTAAGTASFTLKVADSLGSQQASFSLQVH